MIGGWLWSEENKGRVLLWYRSKRVKVEGWKKWSQKVTALTRLLISWKRILFCTKFHKLKRKNDDFKKAGETQVNSYRSIWKKKIPRFLRTLLNSKVEVKTWRWGREMEPLYTIFYITCRTWSKVKENLLDRQWSVALLGVPQLPLRLRMVRRPVERHYCR